MGNISLSCVSCIERDHEDNPIKASDLEELEDNTKKHQEAAEPNISAEELKVCEQSKAPSASHDEKLKTRIDAIIKARQSSDQARAARTDCYEVSMAALSIDTGLQPQPACAEPRKQPTAAPSAAFAEPRKQPTAAPSIDTDLQARMNAMVRLHKQPTAASSIDTDLQARMNAIVNARKQPQEAWSGGRDFQALAAELESPSSSLNDRASPVACGKDGGLQEQINMIVGAHARSLKQQRLSLDLSSPSPSPSPAQLVPDWELGFIANRAISQAKERNTPAASAPSLQHNWTTYEDDIAPRHLSFAGCGNLGNVQQDLPSTKLEQIDSTASCTVQAQKKCVDDETCAFNLSEIPSPTRNRAKKQRSLWADVEIQDADVEELQQKVPADEPEQTAAGKEDAASHKEMSAKLLRQLAEKEEMAAMSKFCVEAFLESVKKCAWRERVRTPIKGSNLYTKHIRPCRPAGTSVDVKDSSFRNLASFLQFLEAEWLLRLKPGLTDPVVNEIYFDACRKYKYDAQRQERFLAACLPGTTKPSWQ